MRLNCHFLRDSLRRRNSGQFRPKAHRLLAGVSADAHHRSERRSHRHLSASASRQTSHDSPLPALLLWSYSRLRAQPLSCRIETYFFWRTASQKWCRKPHFNVLRTLLCQFTLPNGVRHGSRLVPRAAAGRPLPRTAVVERLQAMRGPGEDYSQDADSGSSRTPLIHPTPFRRRESSLSSSEGAQPLLRPLHLVVRETEFCGLRSAKEPRSR